MRVEDPGPNKGTPIAVNQSGYKLSKLAQKTGAVYKQLL